MKITKGLVSLAIALLIVPWFAFVLTKLWGWFVVPLHVSQLSLWQAAGLVVTGRFALVPRNLIRESEDGEGVGQAIAIGFLYPLLMLGVGAIYHELSR